MCWSVEELGSAGNSVRSWYGSVGEKLAEDALYFISSTASV